MMFTRILWASAMAFGMACGASAQQAELLSEGDHYFMREGVRLHYVARGQGPLLVVASPGWGPGSLYLQRGLAPLEKRRTVLYLDERGSGESGRPSRDEQMSGVEMAADIEQLRLTLGVEKLALLGHSDGGTIAIEYAETHPERVSELLLIDSITRGESSENKREEAERERLQEGLKQDPRYKQVFEAFQSTRQGDEAFAESMMRSMPLFFADPERNIPKYLRQIEGTRFSAYAYGSHNRIDESLPYRQMELLGRIRARTLVLVGRKDYVCPVLTSQNLAKGVADAHLEVIDGAGHFPWVEQPESFFAAVNAFLAGGA